MSLKLSDGLNLSKDSLGTSAPNKPSFWVKTQILGGYGLHKNSQGISELDEVVFDTTNMVPLGGVQFAMEMIYGVKGPISVPRLDQEPYNIGAVGSSVSPSQGMPYAYGQKVCLFGVGYGGTEENNLTVIDVKYNDYEVSSTVPFRYTIDRMCEIYRDKKIDAVAGIESRGFIFASCFAEKMGIPFSHSWLLTLSKSNRVSSFGSIICLSKSLAEGDSSFGR